jgi:clathrin heavy chain
LGQLEKIVLYCNKVNYSPDYFKILRSIIPHNPDNAIKFAKMFCAKKEKPSDEKTEEEENEINERLTALNKCLDIFAEFNQIQKVTIFLIEALKQNLEVEGPLQTKILELNLSGAQGSSVQVTNLT